MGLVPHNVLHRLNDNDIHCMIDTTISTATHIAYGALSLEPLLLVPLVHIATRPCGNNCYV